MYMEQRDMTGISVMRAQIAGVKTVKVLVLPDVEHAAFSRTEEINQNFGGKNHANPKLA